MQHAAEKHAGHWSTLGSALGSGGGDSWLAPHDPPEHCQAMAQVKEGQIVLAFCWADVRWDERKLLVRRKELNKLMGAVTRDGMTLIPLGLYFSDRGIAKIELGLAKGKRKADKRAAEKERDWKRDKGRILRARNM